MSLIEDIQIGTVISFKSKNTTDPNTYYGMVKGFLTYELVRPYFDVDAYHNSVVNIVGYQNIPPKEELHYFIIKLPTTQELIYFAIEWIDENTFQIIEKEGSVTIDILNITENDLNNIISILATNGYVGIIRKFNSEVEYK